MDRHEVTAVHHFPNHRSGFIILPFLPFTGHARRLLTGPYLRVRPVLWATLLN